MHTEPKCKVSTGICGHLTFGFGELDDFGYWQYPCFDCAREFERNNPHVRVCWPFVREEPIPKLPDFPLHIGTHYQYARPDNRYYVPIMSGKKEVAVVPSLVLIEAKALASIIVGAANKYVSEGGKLSV